MIRSTAEPFLNLHGKDYTREQVFAAYTKADNGEALTQEEARLAGAWCVHPLISNIGQAPFGFGQLLMRYQRAEALAPSPQQGQEPEDDQPRSETREISPRLQSSATTDGGVTTPAPTHGWRCFHCDEVFTDESEAREHFGADMNRVPACRLLTEDVKQLRALEELHDKLRREIDLLDNDARLWHESEADRVRRIGNCQWWQELDSREGERLALVEENERLRAEALAPSPEEGKNMLSLHRCKVCGTRWLLWPDAIHGAGWNLLDTYSRPGSCCDNAVMGEQIEHVRDFDLSAFPRLREKGI